MNSLLLLIGAIIIFIIAYLTYGRWLSKKWGIDFNKKTPANTLNDGVDYVPTDAKVLLGHHFSSIAGAGPITGPILASVFGWLPVYLWIIIGSIFIGGVHDFGALFASLRHDGKGIGEIIKVNIGKRGKLLFNLFAYAALILVVAAFTSICSGTFAYNLATPEDLTGARAGTASILFIFLAFIFGYFVYRKSANLGISTIVGVIGLFVCIGLGYLFPILKLSQSSWNIILIIYISLASILPVWILLQPRDYLCSFLLYAMLIIGILGIIVSAPKLSVIPMFAGFKVNGNSLFPFLFITVACGAVSGFHSLISSGTTSKQVNSEKDAQFIGYGSMLIEGIVAVIAIIVASSVASTDGATPAQIFSNGLATFMNKFGLPLEVGRIFVTLTFSAFALTSLDTATRIGRYVFQELFDDASEPLKKFCGNIYVSTIVTVLLATILLSCGYEKIWPIFGATNQLLGALSLLAITSWLAKTRRKTIMTIIPMFFMFIVTLVALILLIKTNLTGANPNYILGIIAIILFLLAIIIILESFISIKKAKSEATK